MVLTKEKEQEIIEKINEAIKKKTGQTNLQCSVCTNNQFSFVGGFTNDFLMDKLGGGLIIGGPVLPSVPIVCTNCGNTFFLNAKVLGIEFDEEVEPKENKENEKLKKEEKKNG